MKNFRSYLFVAIAWTVTSLIYPWVLLYPIWIFGTMAMRMFQLAPYGYFPMPPEYMLRLVGVLIGLICIAIILYFQRRSILKTDKVGR